MQGFPGGTPDALQLQATMLAIEQACSLIQVRTLSSPLLLPRTFSMFPPCQIQCSLTLRAASVLYLDLVLIWAVGG